MSVRPKTTISFRAEAPLSSESKTQSEAEEEYDSEKERDETLYHVSGAELRELYSTPDPTYAERQHPLNFSASDSDFASGTFNVQESIGAAFSDSLYTHGNDGLQCSIRARGGSERQWYQGSRISFYSEPEPQVYDMNLELINQIQRPAQHTARPAFTDGQVVWRRRAVRETEGCYMAYDPNPYIIYRQPGARHGYLLIDHAGRLHQELVPPESLELVSTTWTAVRLPNAWYSSQEATDVYDRSSARKRTVENLIHGRF
jgi:hypothetical protein